MTQERVGFFEESAGVYSMARLLAFLLVCGCLGLVCVAAIVSFTDPSAATLAALGSPIAALAGGSWAAMRERHMPDLPTPEIPPPPVS